MNRDGNEVLPAGIENIKRHIREVDDVPLLVSLYANATPSTTLQMLDLLQKNGEIVTCVGSALRTSNFDTFTQAACSISILTLPYTLCADCHGRTDAGSFYSPVLLPDLAFSAAMTSLPCSLQSHAVSVKTEGDAHMDEADPNEAYAQFLLELLYSSLQEARRIVASVEMILIFYVSVCSAYVSILLLLQHIFALPPMLTSLEAVLLPFFLLPSTLSTPVVHTSVHMDEVRLPVICSSCYRTS